MNKATIISLKAFFILIYCMLCIYTCIGAGVWYQYNVKPDLPHSAIDYLWNMANIEDFLIMLLMFEVSIGIIYNRRTKLCLVVLIIVVLTAAALVANELYFIYSIVPEAFQGDYEGCAEMQKMFLNDLGTVYFIVIAMLFSIMALITGSKSRKQASPINQ